MKREYAVTFTFTVETEGPSPVRSEKEAALRDILDNAPEYLDGAEVVK